VNLLVLTEVDYELAFAPELFKPVCEVRLVDEAFAVVGDVPDDYL